MRKPKENYFISNDIVKKESIIKGLINLNNEKNKFLRIREKKVKESRELRQEIYNLSKEINSIKNEIFKNIKKLE